MPEQRDPFFPRRVDESIEELTSITRSDGAFHAGDSNARLVRDMQRLYGLDRRRYQRALQRVEDRLVAQRLTRGESGAVAAPVPPVPRQDTPAPRKNHQGRVYSMENRQPSKFGRRLSLLVAVLVMAVLVGSLVVVLNSTRQNPTTVAHGKTPTPTATPTSAPGASFGKTLYTTPGNQFGFEDLAWSPDSKRVASFTDGVQIWDATTGKHLVKVQLSGSAFTYAMAWSPNGQLIAIGTNQGIALVNGQTGAIVHTYPVSTTASVSSSAGGAHLSALVPASGGLGVRGLAWSPDAHFLAVAISGGATGTLEVVNAQTGAPAYSLPITGNYVPTNLAWSSDGKYLAANVFNTEPGNSTVPLDQAQMIWAWKISTHQLVFKHSGGNGTGDTLAWQPHTYNLAFASWTPLKGGGMTSTLAVMDVASGKLVHQYTVGAFGPVAWSPDGNYLACVSYNGQGAAATAPDRVSIFDANTQQQVYVYKQHHLNIGALAWSPNGKYIVSGEGNTMGKMVAKVWTAE
jgi:WD40 repeat protein